jgi:hypothetical protein
MPFIYNAAALWLHYCTSLGSYAANGLFQFIIEICAAIISSNKWDEMTPDDQGLNN